MMCQPSAEIPWAVGAADIHVVTRLNLQDAEFAEADPRSLARREHQGIGSRLRADHLLVCAAAVPSWVPSLYGQIK
jgi:hypothetical protein